jgi:hypothetical protein
MDRSALGKILLLVGMASYVSMGVLLGLYFQDFAKRSLIELWVLFIASSIGVVITARAICKHELWLRTTRGAFANHITGSKTARKECERTRR